MISVGKLQFELKIKALFWCYTIKLPGKPVFRNNSRLARIIITIKTKYRWEGAKWRAPLWNWQRLNLTWGSSKLKAALCLEAGARVWIEEMVFRFCLESSFDPFLYGSPRAKQYVTKWWIMSALFNLFGFIMLLRCSPFWTIAHAAVRKFFG